MAVGDGVTWNEALPDNSTLAHQIDDYNRDLRVGIRSRLAKEHIFESSQTGTGEGGQHRYITFQQQTAAPTLGVVGTVSTQVGAIFVGSSGDGYPLTFENSAGTSVVLVNSAGNIPVISGGTQGGIAICSSANPNAVIMLTASAIGYVLTSRTGTAAPNWQPSLAMSGTGATATLITLTGNQGPTYTGHSYYYLTIGISTADGQVKMVSGVSTASAAIPLPDGCPQANCHWIISPRYYRLNGVAMHTFSSSIGDDRLVTMGVSGDNWVG